MPNGVLTILDILKANSADIMAPLVDEIGRLCPEITGQSIRGVSVPTMGAAKTITGVSYEILVRTELPSVAFRNANEGTDPTKSQHTLRTVECFSATPKWGVDQVVSDRSKEGLAVLMAREAKAHVQALMQHCCKQFYTGTTNDAKGFTGLKAQYNSADMTVDATGTGSALTSVWGVKFGPEFVQWVYGNNGNFNVKDIRIGDLEDASGKNYTAFIQELICHIGLQMGNKYGVGRIKNLHASDNNKTLDDDMLADLLSKAPAGYEFDCFLMSRRSLKQLRASRTATNTTGAPAPFPTEAHGVPIVVTDSILETDSAE